jgi:hypothetical protein
MARYPKATWRPLPEAGRQPGIVPNKVILHSVVGSGSPYAYFAKPGVVVESTFWVGLDGRVEQYMDSLTRADANYEANTSAISIETADNGDPDHFAWTVAQVEALSELLAWAHTIHGIPLTACTSWTGAGVGYHAQFPQWSPVKKTCPGTVRVPQVPVVIKNAQAIVRASTGDDMPTPNEFAEALMDVQAGEGAGAVSYGQSIYRTQTGITRLATRQLILIKMLASAFPANQTVQNLAALAEKTSYPGELPVLTAKFTNVIGQEEEMGSLP